MLPFWIAAWFSGDASPSGQSRVAGFMYGGARRQSVTKLRKPSLGLSANHHPNARLGQSIDRSLRFFRISNDYSSLRATIGGSFAALLAGTVLANTATTATPKHAVAIIAGS